MQIYSVHLPPDPATDAAPGTAGARGASVTPESAPIAAPVFVREGFAWRGFLFDALWLASKGLWWAAAAVVVTWLVIGELWFKDQLNTAAAVCLIVGVKLLIGFLGWDFRRHRLSAEGYRDGGHVVAPDPVYAAFRWAQARSPGDHDDAAPSPPAARSEPRDGTDPYAGITGA